MISLICGISKNDTNENLQNRNRLADTENRLVVAKGVEGVGRGGLGVWDYACMLCLFSPVRLCNPVGHSLPGFSVHGILQARRLEWAAMPSFQGLFPTQGLNPHRLCLLHWQVGSLPLGPPGKPSWD